MPRFLDILWKRNFKDSLQRYDKKQGLAASKPRESIEISEVTSPFGPRGPRLGTLLNQLQAAQRTAMERLANGEVVAAG